MKLIKMIVLISILALTVVPALVPSSPAAASEEPVVTETVTDWTSQCGDRTIWENAFNKYEYEWSTNINGTTYYRYAKYTFWIPTLWQYSGTYICWR